MNTPFVQLRFSLELPSDKPDPHALFAIRQQFHAAFRRAAGCFHPTLTCAAGVDCPCRYVFDQKLATDPSALRRYQKPPLPFAFRIPLIPKELSLGDAVELTLAVVGEAIRHLDLFIGGIMHLFAPSGSFKDWQVIAVEAVSVDKTLVAIPSNRAGRDFNSLPLLSFDDFFSETSVDCSRLTMNFQTPLRLIHKGSPLRNLSFSAVAGALFRRISSLAYYYGREELPNDFKWLARQSQQVVCSRSDLHWVNRGGSLQGVEGQVEFSGAMAEFIPFLHLGKVLNIGKGAAYGMGSYSFSVD
jgi:hypothetical protein